MSIEESSATPIEDVANHSTIFNLNQSQESIMETEDKPTGLMSAGQDHGTGGEAAGHAQVRGGPQRDQSDGGPGDGQEVHYVHVVKKNIPWAVLSPNIGGLGLEFSRGGREDI